MNERTNQESVVKAIIDANQYMTLATADEHGTPWASPVWYATDDYREFFWVSSPDARHSRNIEGRPELAIVIFDSRQAPYTGQGVYIAATAGQLGESALAGGIATFSRISHAQGLVAWEPGDVKSPARHRLYHAVARQHFVLSQADRRIPVNLT
jgi:uncharacterized protein YhbP (UPF0306 family)